MIFYAVCCLAGTERLVLTFTSVVNFEAVAWWIYLSACAAPYKRLIGADSIHYVHLGVAGILMEIAVGFIQRDTGLPAR
jgi:hypothetical protein